jgi:CheY-like chemotaxis protein
LMIAQTGWGQARDRQRSQEAGFDAHLTKPVDCATLMELLSSSLPKEAGHTAVGKITSV